MGRKLTLHGFVDARGKRCTTLYLDEATRTKAVALALLRRETLSATLASLVRDGVEKANG